MQVRILLSRISFTLLYLPIPQKGTEAFSYPIDRTMQQSVKLRGQVFMLYQQNIHRLLFFLRLKSQCKDVSSKNRKKIFHTKTEKNKSSNVVTFQMPYNLFVCMFFSYFFLYCTELNLTFFQNFIFGNLENQYMAHGKLAVLASPVTILQVTTPYRLSLIRKIKVLLVHTYKRSWDSRILVYHETR